MSNKSHHRAALLEWMTWDGFPPKQRNGWPKAECRDWIHANHQKLAEYWSGQELASGKVSRNSMQFLRQGQAGKDMPPATPNGHANQTTAAADPRGDIFKVADTQVSLASKLQAYYGNRIRILISHTKIQDWRNNRNMPGPNIPPPPACEGKYWNPVAWIEWFDRWMLRHYLRPEDGQQNLIGGADIYQFEEQVKRKELEYRLKEIEIEEGKWIGADLHNRCADRFCAELNAAINQHAELTLTRILRRAVDDMRLPDEVRLPLLDRVQTACRAAVDGLRVALQGLQSEEAN